MTANATFSMLPVETIMEILSLAIDRPPASPDISSALKLRSVSRQFRIVIDGLNALSRLIFVAGPRDWGFGPTVDLETISRYPWLRHLKIESCPYRGTLSLASKLETLEVVWSKPADDNDFEDFPEDSTALVPINSAASLTALTIIGSGPEELSILPDNSLNPFLNLKLLNIYPINDNICQFLIGTNIRLTDFDLSFDELEDDVTPQAVISLLAAPSLQNLKNLTLRLMPRLPEMEIEMLRAVVRLRMVEKLELTTWTLDTSWAEWFSSMPNIRSIWWRVTEKIIPDDKSWTYDDCIKIIVEAFDNAFTDSDIMPKIEVEIDF